ncbi:MAG: pentapeptide repeat-containing protein [Nitrospinae bacterium]|nr:pentapeptide repeat-containing protein [Nitrospinota bacterium]
MTIPIPDHLKDLPEISAEEIREMTGEGSVRFEGKVVQGDALEALHGAFFKGVPVHVEGSFIGGDLDLTNGIPVFVEELEGIDPDLKKLLENRGLSEVVILTAPIFIGRGTRIQGALLAGQMVVFSSYFSFSEVTIAERVFLLGATFGPLASFRDTEFAEEAVFSHVNFAGVASFDGTIFGKGASFNGATFGDSTSFKGATFGEGTSFEGATFGVGANFLGATFGGGASFEYATFGKKARFGSATFGEEARFDGATFGEGASFRLANIGAGVNFEEAKFGRGASFEFARFDEMAGFVGATFGEEARFSSATFGERSSFHSTIFGEGASFTRVNFRAGAKFIGTTFQGSAVFLGRRGREGEEEEFVFGGEVDFRNLILEAPDKVRFQHANLSQARFLNTRLDKIQFIDVDWHEREGRKALYDEEFAEEGYELVAQLYRQLKKNYEEQRDYPGAGDFHYGEMEMTLKQQWKDGKFLSWLLTRAYKFLSGYGEEPLWAIYILFWIWVLPAILAYMQPIMSTDPSPGFFGGLLDSLLVSIKAMSLRLPETPKPILGKFVMILQVFLGPIQLALTALALRRKFQR